MKNQNHSSFGARLRGGQDILVNISSFENYKPPREEETPDSYGSVVNDTISTTGEEAALQENYSMAVSIRQKSFKGDANSIEKILAPIRGAIVAQFGKDSKEVQMVKAIIKTMRSTKLVKPPAATEITTEAKQTANHSAHTYAAMTMHFNDLTSTITQFNGYTSSNASITNEGLKQLCISLNDLNNNVMQAYNLLVVSRSKRDKLFAELSDRTSRIKAYVKSQYGLSSNEYKLIKGAKV